MLEFVDTNRRLNKEELKIILENHLHWLKEDCDNWREMRADLSYADLRGADLHNAILVRADLKGADLRGANLSNANLQSATLDFAKLNYANLWGANLSNVTLYCANLHDANLNDVLLFDADLNSANLSRVNLTDANLNGANLNLATLRGAILRNVTYDEGTSAYALCCPEEGSFIGWKKCRNKMIVKLLITEDAKRSSATSRKCRCSKATVIQVEDIDGNVMPDDYYAISKYDGDTTYKKGKTIVVDNFDENRWNECSTGIHFFITRDEAVKYG